MISPAQSGSALIASAVHAARSATEALLEARNEEGYWSSEISAGPSLSSDYVLLQLWLHPASGSEWNPPTRRLVDKAVASIIRHQLPDGGFNIYPRGPADVSATVKAYFALKAGGLKPDDTRMRKARDCVLALGGIQAANMFVKTNLSLFGLYPKHCVPAVPVEVMLAPGNPIYEIPSWIRAILVPLSIVQTVKAGRRAPAGFDLKELFRPDIETVPRNDSENGGKTLFPIAGRLVRLLTRLSPPVIRRRAIQAAENWILERSRGSNGLTGIYPAMMYSAMALSALGYEADRPERTDAEERLSSLMVEGAGSVRFRPFLSPVSDTAIAALAVGEAGTTPRVIFRRTAEWLLAQESRSKGDWSVKRPETEPGGWPFGDFASFYPNANDTAMALLSLRHMTAGDAEAQEAAARRALRWLRAMQSAGGGWAAFDPDSHMTLLKTAPFADFSVMADPACADVTGRVLEALREYGFTGSDPAIRKGVQYLIHTQEQDGSWRGRWGVNYLHGTFSALRGLRAAGEDGREAYILRAGEWIRGIQNADGGWGESCESYDVNEFVPAPSTASQTAWAIMGLLAGGDNRSDSLGRGIEHLISRQNPDGTWDEVAATGTGFPGMCYLTCPLYSNSFPLLALASYIRANTTTKGDLG